MNLTFKNRKWSSDAFKVHVEIEDKNYLDLVDHYRKWKFGRAGHLNHLSFSFSGHCKDAK